MFAKKDYVCGMEKQEIKIEKTLDHILNFLKEADCLEGNESLEILSKIDKDNNTELRQLISPIFERLERDNFIFDVN